MSKLNAVVLMILLTIFFISNLGCGFELEEIIFNITLSGGLSAGVDFSWHLDKLTYLRSGVNLGIDLVPQISPKVFFWGRLVYLININPQDHLSFFGGGGLSSLLVFTGQTTQLKPFPEAGLGTRYAINDIFSLSGELRFYLPPTDQYFGDKIKLIGLNSGVGFSIK